MSFTLMSLIFDILYKTLYSITGGDDGFSRNHTYYGGNIGSVGYVFEYHDYRADGYKNIKGTGNDTDSGFDKQTDLIKLRYTPMNSAWNQTFEITSSNTSETSPIYFGERSYNSSSIYRRLFSCFSKITKNKT